MVSNSLVKKEGKQTFSAFITNDAIKNKINQMVGGKDGQTFITAILSAVSNNPQLAECEHGSILSAALLGQSLNLSPSPQLGQYYLVPFNNSKQGTKVAQFQLGYKGYVQLAERSGYYKKLNVIAIKEGELVKFDPLNEDIEVKLIEDEEQRENAPTIGYYAMFEYQNGFRKAIYWTKSKMENHANKYSMGYKAKKGYTFWEKDFDGMAYKTMLRQLISKWGIMSIDLQTAIEKDMGEVKEDGTVDYIDNATYEKEEPVVIESKATNDKEEIPTQESEDDYEDPFI
jgi:recombination protein RecT